MRLNIIFRNGKSRMLDIDEIGNIEVNININETLGCRVVLQNKSENLDLRLMKIYDELITLYEDDIDPLDINIISELQILDEKNSLVGQTLNCTLAYSFVETRMNEILFFDQRKQVALDISK